MNTAIIEILVTLLLSAFFSGTEIAFVSSNKLRFEVDKASRSFTSRILTIYYNHPNNFISTLLVGNNVCLVIYGILMAHLLDMLLFSRMQIDEWASLLLQTIISTLIVLVTGEFLPKTLFRINPNKALSIVAFPAFVFYVLLFPVSKFTSSLSKFILRLFGVKVVQKDSDNMFTKVDLDYLIQSSIDNTQDEKAIDDDVKLFQNALEFSDIKVRDCIVPRTEIQAVDINTDVEDLKSRFIESGNSKIIVYEEDIDHILGYIHSSEMFRHSSDWSQYIRKLPIVPETMPAQRLMKMFMQEKKSLAVVVDEFGGTSGIVSLEDLVEEIFGDIEDEHDNINYVAKKVGEGEYILSARLETAKVNEMFDLDLPESDDYLTLGGLILHHYQSFPKLNEEVEIGHFSFKILKSSTTKIELVRLKVSQ
jgi:CBS domain containing-hemolysin-like protein